MEANGTGVTSGWNSGSRRRTKAGAYQPKVSKVTDGSLLDTAGNLVACGWSVVPVDYDEELEPLHGM